MGARRVFLGEHIGGMRLADEALEFQGGQGAAEVKSLILVASGRFQEIQLGERLHAFGDHFQAQAVCQRHDGAYDRRVLRPAHDFVDEHAVYLELVDGKAAQVAHAGIAGTEIIHGNQHAHGAQVFENGDGFLRIAHHRAFREFDFEVAGLQACVAECAADESRDRRRGPRDARSDG